MISLNRHMAQQAERELADALEAYRGLVGTIAAGGKRVCPTLGDDLRSGLLSLRDHLNSASVTQTSREVERRVEQWSERAGEYYAGKTVEIREVLLALTEAAAAAGERRRRHRAEFEELGSRLRRMGDLDDLTEIRRVVRQAANDLRDRTVDMAREDEESLAALRAQVATYRERLEVAEEMASRAPEPGGAGAGAGAPGRCGPAILGHDARPERV